MKTNLKREILVHPIRIATVLANNGKLEMQVDHTEEWIKTVKDTPENRQAIVNAMKENGCRQFGDSEYHFTSSTVLLGDWVPQIS